MGKKEMILPEKVKEAVGDREVLGFVTGFGLFKKLTATIIVTETGVIFYDPHLTGADKTEIPFPQILRHIYAFNRSAFILRYHTIWYNFTHPCRK